MSPCTMSLQARSMIKARPVTGVAAGRSRTAVMAVKQVNERNPEQGPSQTAVRLFGALTAVQLALLPAVAPAEAFNLFPKTATSQAARDALNKKTDNLPTLRETGRELFGGGDPLSASSAKDVGKAIDKNTPNVDLTKNPKDVRKDVGKAVKNALPDVSAVPTADEIAKKARGGASKAGGQVSKAGGILSGKANNAGGILSGNANKAGGLLSGKASSAADQAKSAGNKAASKVPSVKDIQRKLNSPLGTMPAVYDLAAGLRGEDNQSQNNPEPSYQSSKRSQRGMNADIGPLPDRLPSPEATESRTPPQSEVGGQTPFAKAGVGKASDISLPRPDKALEKLNVPNPVNAAKKLISQ